MLVTGRRPETVCGESTAGRATSQLDSGAELELEGVRIKVQGRKVTCSGTGRGPWQSRLWRPGVLEGCADGPGLEEGARCWNPRQVTQLL